MQVALLAPHPLEAGAEFLAQELLPLLALLATPAPVQLEEHMGVQMAIDLLHVDLDLLRAPERGRGDGHVSARRRADRVVAEVELLLGPLALCAELARAGPELLHERPACAGVDQLVHHGEALEGVLAIEDARLVDLLGLLAAGIQRAVAEGAVDRRSSDQY